MAPALRLGHPRDTGSCKVPRLASYLDAVCASLRLGSVSRVTASICRAKNRVGDTAHMTSNFTAGCKSEAVRRGRRSAFAAHGTNAGPNCPGIVVGQLHDGWPAPVSPIWR